MTTAERRIDELQPKHDQAPWAGHTHPEDHRRMEDLNMWRSNNARHLEYLERRIQTCYRNIEFTNAELSKVLTANQPAAST